MLRAVSRPIRRAHASARSADSILINFEKPRIHYALSFLIISLAAIKLYLAEPSTFSLHQFIVGLTHAKGVELDRGWLYAKEGIMFVVNQNSAAREGIFF